MGKEQVNNPEHYGGKENPYEAIKIIEALDLGFHLGNTVKYVARTGKKNPAKTIEDLKKAEWYLKRKIEQLESEESQKKPQPPVSNTIDLDN